MCLYNVIFACTNKDFCHTHMSMQYVLTEKPWAPKAPWAQVGRGPKRDAGMSGIRAQVGPRPKWNLGPRPMCNAQRIESQIVINTKH
jgi:hypothetical protein